MAEVRIHLTVHGRDDLIDELDDFDKLTSRVVVRNPGACRRCRDNEDPDAIPVHTNPPCRCSWRWEDE